MHSQNDTVSVPATQVDPPPLTHITSFIVHTQPNAIAAVSTAIAHIPRAEIYHVAAEGKLIVLLESATLQDITAVSEQITAMTGVFNTSMVFHQMETTRDLEQVIDS